MSTVGSCKGGNTIPLDDQGRPYHYGCKHDEIANEFLIVSCYDLAKAISQLFDKDVPVFERVSNRGYTTYTGNYKGKRLSVVAFGIGFAMIDFLVREIRAITTGRITFVQLGEAPSPSGIELGTVLNVKDCVAYEIDFNEFGKSECPYRFFAKPVEADAKVYEALQAGLAASKLPAASGRVASNPSFSAGINAPSFKSGGTGPFNFKSEGLIEKLQEKCGKIDSLEMDTYPLYWTALREVNHEISAGCLSVVSSHIEGKAMSQEDLRKRQLEVAAVILEQLGNLQ